MHYFEKIIVKNLMLSWRDSAKYVNLIRDSYPCLIDAYEIKYSKIFLILKLRVMNLSDEDFNKIFNRRYGKIKSEYSLLINDCSEYHNILIKVMRDIRQAINNYSILLSQVNSLYQLARVSPDPEKWYNEFKNSELNKESVFGLLTSQIKSVDSLYAKLEVLNTLTNTYHQLVIADMVKSNSDTDEE